MSGTLSGQHAVVTGGGRGIGAAIALALVRNGANVTLLGRTASTLRDQVGRLVMRPLSRVPLRRPNVVSAA